MHKSPEHHPKNFLQTLPKTIKKEKKIWRMKLASLRNAPRDGQLVVVSKDLTKCSEGQSHSRPHFMEALEQLARGWHAPANALPMALKTGPSQTQRFRDA